MPITKTTKSIFNETGNIARFASQLFTIEDQSHFEFKELANQCYIIGYRSMALVGLTGFIMGLVLTMQLQPKLISYGIDSQLPMMVGIAIVREIGPVITALIFAGKIGSSIGAELGSMKVTEQIDAMEVSGTNPFKYLVATRIVATTLMLPILTVLSDAIALYGGYLGINIRTVTSFQLFFTQVFQTLGYRDILPALVKTFFFGYVVGLIGCYKGYNSNNGTQGVGSSANSAVVISSVLIFVVDLLAVQVTNLLGLNI